MNNRHLFVLVVLLVYGCSTVIDFDVPYQPSVVVDAKLCPEIPIEVRLSYDKFVLEDAYNYLPVKEATVNVYEEGNLLAVLPHVSNGIYSLPELFPVEGKVYHIEIDVDGLPTIYAKTKIPEIIPKLSLLSVEETIANHGGKEYIFTVAVTDVAGEQYYDLSLMFESEGLDTSVDPPVWDTVYLPSLVDSEDVVIKEDDYNALFFLFNDHMISEATHIITFKNFGFQVRRQPPFELPIKIVLKSVTKDYYLFEKSFRQQYMTYGKPFAEPVIVYSNIENGKGLFAGYNQTVIDTVVDINP